jgi:co-chaperonin GroES (HSP10)
MQLVPRDKTIALELSLPRASWAKKIKARSGLLVPPPDKMYSFEGIPQKGVVYALPESYKGPLKAGMLVIFKDNAPKAFKFEGKDLAIMELSKITAIVDPSEDKN